MNLLTIEEHQTNSLPASSIIVEKLVNSFLIERRKKRHHFDPLSFCQFKYAPVDATGNDTDTIDTEGSRADYGNLVCMFLKARKTLCIATDVKEVFRCIFLGRQYRTMQQGAH